MGNSKKVQKKTIDLSSYKNPDKSILCFNLYVIYLVPLIFKLGCSFLNPLLLQKVTAGSSRLVSSVIETAIVVWLLMNLYMFS